MTVTGLESRTTYFVNKHSTIWPNWPNHGVVFSVLICTVQVNVCSYHVTYAFQSESSLYSCPNVSELLARRRRGIWSLSDCNWNPNQNHLLAKRTLNYLAKLTKWFSSFLTTYLYNAIKDEVFSCLVPVL